MMLLIKETFESGNEWLLYLLLRVQGFLTALLIKYIF